MLINIKSQIKNQEVEPILEVLPNIRNPMGQGLFRPQEEKNIDESEVK